MVEKNDVVTFLDDVIKRFEQFSLLHNSSKKVDTESWDTPMGRLDVMKSTGDTFEKAGLIYCDLAIETPPVLAEKLGQQGSKAQVYVLEINFYPHNPFIPRGYMELRVNITNTIVLAGGTDIFPYFSQHEEESTFFADGMKELCASHGQDYNQLRKTREDFFVSKYRKEKVGSHAGIYSFQLEEKDFSFFKGIADGFFQRYGEIIERGKARPYTPEDVESKLLIHGIWTQWVLLEDEGTKYGLEKGIPPDALLGGILPPRATF
jgi:coproporphyrinogen III oxidase